MGAEPSIQMTIAQKSPNVDNTKDECEALCLGAIMGCFFNLFGICCIFFVKEHTWYGLGFIITGLISTGILGVFLFPIIVPVIPIIIETIMSDTSLQVFIVANVVFIILLCVCVFTVRMVCETYKPSTVEDV